MMERPIPRRGELWWFDPEPTKGRELGKKIRPALVISVDEINEGPSGKIIVIPGTSKDHGIPSHVRLDYTRKGEPTTTFFCCEDIRAISVERLKSRMAPKPLPTRQMAMVEQWVKRLLGL